MKLQRYITETISNKDIWKQLKEIKLKLTGIQRVVKIGNFPYDTPEHLKEILTLELTSLKVELDNILRSI